jgi:hypothetical protein
MNKENLGPIAKFLAMVVACSIALCLEYIAWALVAWSPYMSDWNIWCRLFFVFGVWTTSATIIKFIYGED